MTQVSSTAPGLQGSGFGGQQVSDVELFIYFLGLGADPMYVACGFSCGKPSEAGFPTLWAWDIGYTTKTEFPYR